MKRNLIAACTALLLATTAHAQQQPHTFAITPRVGISVSNFTGTMPATISYAVAAPVPPSDQLHMPLQNHLTAGSVEHSDSKSKVGLAVAVEAQYQFSTRFGLSVGAMYVQQGARYESAGQQFTIGEHGIMSIGNDLKINLHTLGMPILANVYVWRGLAVKAGLQPEFFLSKKLSGDVSLQIDNQTTTMTEGNMDGLKSFALSLPIGLSYEYKNIVVDCRYHIGLTNMKKEGDAGKHADSQGSRNSTFAVTMGYKFGL